MELSSQTLLLTLSNSFTSHKASSGLQINQILVQLIWQGLTGYGIAVFNQDYGGSSQAIQVALTAYKTLLVESTPFSLTQLLDHLADTIPAPATALAAVDMALHDLFGQILGMPLYQLLNLNTLLPPNTAVSLGLMSPQDTLSKVQEYITWPILKLKMSAPNINLIKSVREIYSGRLWLDGNGAWSPQQAVLAAEQLHPYNIELIEQPIPPGSVNDLQFVHKNSPILIIADEDCVTPEDVFKLKDCVGGINIKLVKCGGIQRALKMIRLAKQAGLKIMLGCKTESVLGITAIAHLASAADFLDLDGHLDIKNDPFSGLIIQNGKLSLPVTPGLGVTYHSQRELTLNNFSHLPAVIME